MSSTCLFGHEINFVSLIIFIAYEDKMRVVVRSDGVAVETVRPPDQNGDPPLPDELANDERVVVL